ncbi:MAG: hypothetical protein JWO44_1724 [Bacteroidetes bacterium]|nr:hypothetical protein [Bacteroidota bacterium]
MRKTLLLLFFIGCLSNLGAQSWVYHPFPASDALWRESSGDYPCNCCRDYQYSINGDTVIGGNTYHRLKWSGIFYDSPNVPYVGGSYWGCASSPPPYMAYLNSTIASFYPGAFREDVANKRIYFIEPGNTTDTLLYDFNLAVGDTLPDSYISDQSFYHNIVSSIDSVLVGGVYRKRFNINDGPSTYVSLVEGVGSTFGFLGALSPPFESQSVLDCFKLADTLAYQPSGGLGCSSLALTVGRLNDLDQAVYVYPNPGTGNFKLSMSFLREDMRVEARDVFGKLILDTKIKNLSTEIDLGSQPAGVYFLKVSDAKGNSVTKKIVKQ